MLRSCTCRSSFESWTETMLFMSGKAVMLFCLPMSYVQPSELPSKSGFVRMFVISEPA